MKGDYIVVKFKLRAGRGITLSTSTLLKHFWKTAQQRKAHGNTVHADKDEPSATEEDGCNPTSAKQPKLDFNHRQRATTSIKELIKLLTAYAIDEMLPICTIDSPSFRHILERIPWQQISQMGGADTEFEFWRERSQSPICEV